MVETLTEELIAALRALAADLGRHPGAATATDAADRLEALTAPAEGMTLETTAKERKKVAEVERGISLRPGDIPGTVVRLLRDFDRLSSALTAERERNERLAGALREARGWIPPYKETVEVRNRIDAALSQEKQT